MARWKIPKNTPCQQEMSILGDKQNHFSKILKGLKKGECKTQTHHSPYENVFFIPLPSEGCVKKHNKKTTSHHFFTQQKVSDTMTSSIRKKLPKTI